MTIHIVCDNFVYWGGLSKVAYYHAKGLSGLGHEVKIWTSKYDFPQAQFPYEIATVPLFKARALTSHMRKIRVPDTDVVISHGGGLGNFFSGNRNFIYVYHGIVPPSLASWWILAVLEQVFQIYKARTVIAVSNYAKRQLRALFRRNSAVVHNGIDVELYRPLGLIKERDVCGIWRTPRRKNTRALQSLGITTCWAGKNSRLNEDELALFYNRARILASASRWESFGLYMAEAMSCGLPVVALNNSAVRETVGDGGVVCSTIDELRASIESLLSNEAFYHELSRRARERAVKNFDYRLAARKLEKILDVSTVASGNAKHRGGS